MNESQTKTLRENRVMIVSDLEPRGKVLDKLYEDGVLTENDLELVSSAKPRKERCQLLLSILPTRGPVAYDSFQKALEDGQYEFLADQLSGGCHDIPGRAEAKTDHDISNQRRADKSCQRCSIFLEKLINERPPINSCLLKIITGHCCLLLDNIEPADVIDQLFQDHMITADDTDDIKAGATRRSRCEKLFKLLLSVQSNRVVESLKNSLMKKYNYIIEKITYDFDDNQLMGQTSNIQTAASITKQNSSIFTCKDVADNAQSILTRSSAEETIQDSVNTFNTSSSVSLEIQLCEETIPKIDDVRRVDDESSKAVTDFSIYDSYKIMKDRTTKSNFNVKDNFVKGEVKTNCDNHTNKTHRNERTDTVDGASVDASVRWRLSDKTNSPYEKDSVKDSSINSLTGTANIPSTETFLTENPVGEITKSKKSKYAHGKRKHKERPQVNDLPTSTNIYHQEINSKQDYRREIVPKQITAIRSQSPSRRLSVAFNYLSTLINQGDFSKFEEISAKLQIQFSRNYDLMCIIGYLQTSRDLFQTNVDSAKSRINSTMDLVPKTSNPRYFMLELFTAKTRMYITRKKLEKLQTTLDEAMMILETDPVGCTGRAAGWLYLNDARSKTTQLSCLNLRRPNSCKVYEHLFESAKTSFQRSMTNFKRESGKDGPFGFGYALCRLVILLLRCGENGLTMISLTPPADDIHTAREYLNHLEDSDILISKILDMHFRLAKCDYQFRRGNFLRALEHAQIAHDIATELRLFEFTEHAFNRLSFLKSKSSIYCVANELREVEANKILFEEPSDDSDYDTKNE